MSAGPARELPLVSVLTPAFNQGQWLGDAIASVRCQTYPRIEHIVMDGGSSDETVAILRDAAGRLTWRSEADRGQSHALNKAFAESQGEIIGWLNSDDAYFDRRVIADVVSAFARNPDISAVFGFAVLTNQFGRVLQVLWSPPFSYRLLRLYNYIVQPTVFVRRRVIADRFVDESYDFMMDRELWLRLGSTEPFLRLPRIIAIDRHHLGRKSETRRDLALADLKRLGAAYGVPSGFVSAGVTKLLKISFRVLGTRYLRAALRADLAFTGSFDTPARFAARQLGSRRARMPLGKVGNG